MSHCWGNQPFFKLTRKTKDRLYSGVPLQDFPPSFRDAIITTRQLRIRFLWIDCYCILQPENEEDDDDVEAKREWHTEALQVRDVYRNAIINFGAAHAQNPSEGCFTTRKLMSASEYCFPFDSHPEGLYRIVNRDFGRYETRDYHKNHALMTRGWVMQERILAPRMLSFGKDQIYWECPGVPEQLVCEGFPDGMFYRDYHTCHFSLTEQCWDTISIPTPIAWTELVEQYSGLDLSFPTKDKLTALAGIAEDYASLVNDDYVAGFFREDLVGLLIWRASVNSSRARIWRAPTWSWASVDGPVGWPFTYSHSDKLVTIEDVNLVPLHPGMIYGPLRSSSTTLEGPLMTIMIQGAVITQKSYSGKSQIMEVQGFEFGMDFDDLQEMQSVGSMLAFLSTSRLYSFFNGLILQHDKTTNVYRRLGAWKLSRLNPREADRFLELAKIGTVTIE